MKYLLDTNICIYVIKKRPASVLRRFKSCNVGDIAISAITYSEMLFGVEKSQHADRNRVMLEMFVSPLEILSYDEVASEKYGVIRSALEKEGRVIGSLDMLIAAHALGAGLTLVTNNKKEFGRIPGLKIENWV